MRPSGLGRDPEHVCGAILVRVLRVGALGLLPRETGMRLFKGVGDVFQEDEAEHDVFVFRGVHRAAEGISHLPEFGFVACNGTRPSGTSARARRLHVGVGAGVFPSFSRHGRFLSPGLPRGVSSSRRICDCRVLIFNLQSAITHS